MKLSSFNYKGIKIYFTEMKDTFYKNKNLDRFSNTEWIKLFGTDTVQSIFCKLDKTKQKKDIFELLSQYVMTKTNSLDPRDLKQAYNTLKTNLQNKTLKQLIKLGQQKNIIKHKFQQFSINYSNSKVQKLCSSYIEEKSSGVLKLKIPLFYTNMILERIQIADSSIKIQQL